MAKIKDPNRPNPWQIISAILAALGSLFGSLKRSHDSAKAEQEKPEPAATPDLGE